MPHMQSTEVFHSQAAALNILGGLCLPCSSLVPPGLSLVSGATASYFSCPSQAEATTLGSFCICVTLLCMLGLNRLYIYMHMYIHTYIHTYLLTYIYTHIHTRCMYAHMHTRICMCIFIPVYLYTHVQYIFTHTHTHTHTYMVQRC